MSLSGIRAVRILSKSAAPVVLRLSWGKDSEAVFRAPEQLGSSGGSREDTEGRCSMWLREKRKSLLEA